MSAAHVTTVVKPRH